MGRPDEIAELREELRHAEEREAAVREVTQTIARSTFDLQLVLQAVVDGAVRLCNAESGNLALRDGDVYRAVAFRSFSPDYQQVARDHVYTADRTTVIGRTVLERDVVHIADVVADPDYTATHLQQAGGYRTALAVPMLRDGVALGAVALGRNEVRPFSEVEIRLLRTFADQVTVAIEQVRLFQTVERQRTELARFAPQVATLLSSDEGEQLLAGHRREITVLFSDLRGFTAFAETAEPEEVLRVLRQYHTAVGEIVVANGGTVEHFAGDGLMAFFNDPVPDPEHALAAVRTAVHTRERFVSLAADWSRRGYTLGLGVGIATGYATLGRIGFEGRYDYAAIGNCVNLAARLSDAAGAGEILISQRVLAEVEARAEIEPFPNLELKGFTRPVTTFRVVGLV
ncbi:MAG: GAF domain-containing protein [Actinobacteria bacterium]|nr:GAF domain-containing protein [Actinomycetota bacterium]